MHCRRPTIRRPLRWASFRPHWRSSPGPRRGRDRIVGPHARGRESCGTGKRAADGPICGQRRPSSSIGIFLMEHSSTAPVWTKCRTRSSSRHVGRPGARSNPFGRALAKPSAKTNIRMGDLLGDRHWQGIPVFGGAFGGKLAAGTGLSVYCCLPCERRAVRDVAALARRVRARSALPAIRSSENHLLPRVPQRRPGRSQHPQCGSFDGKVGNLVQISRKHMFSFQPIPDISWRPIRLRVRATHQASPSS
jgi:hypothetical protein